MQSFYRLIKREAISLHLGGYESVYGAMLLSFSPQDKHDHFQLFNYINSTLIK